MFGFVLFFVLYCLLLLFCVLVLDQRLVGTLVASWFGFINPSGLALFTRKGCVVSNVLDLSLDLSSIMFGF
jgi:hypothetical protein